MKAQPKELTNKFQVVKFRINQVPYALDIGRVREIIYYRPATPLPEAPVFVEGVVDLRGMVIPVIDLKRKIGIENLTREEPSHILILQLGSITAGMVVDEVLEVLQVNREDIQAPQRIHHGHGSRYLEGVVKYSGEMVFILNLESLLTSDEKATISEINP
jgi:purine-binding chemotaxis protein CheW